MKRGEVIERRDPRGRGLKIQLHLAFIGHHRHPVLLSARCNTTNIKMKQLWYQFRQWNV
jgi:hypothetical protein